MRKSTMFQTTVVLAAMLAGTLAFASMLEEEEASPPKWTIANPGDAETINAPVTSIGVGGGHTPEGVSAYVCKIRPHGSSDVSGSVGGNCNQDGTWAGTVSFASSPAPGMYDAGVWPAGANFPDDVNVFHIE